MVIEVIEAETFACELRQDRHDRLAVDLEPERKAVKRFGHDDDEILFLGGAEEWRPILLFSLVSFGQEPPDFRTVGVVDHPATHDRIRNVSDHVTEMMWEKTDGDCNFSPCGRVLEYLFTIGVHQAGR